MRRNQTALKSRTKYLNRIAYLIATKRNTLKRLALKGSVQIKRRVKSMKSANRKLPQRSSARGTRKSAGKRMHRSVSAIHCLGSIRENFEIIICTYFHQQGARHRTRDCNGNNSDVELPKNIAKRRVQHMNAPPYRSNRRVSKVQYYANYGNSLVTSPSAPFKLQLNVCIILFTIYRVGRVVIIRR